MKIRKYEAATVPDALKQVKEDLGPDAIILNTRTASKEGGFMQGPRKVEVTAALDDEPRSVKGEGPKATRRNQKATFELDPSWPGEARVERPKPRLAVEWDGEYPEQASSPDRYQWAALSSELADIRCLIEKLFARQRFGLVADMPGNLSGLMVRLMDRDVEEEVAYELIRHLWRNLRDMEIAPHTPVSGGSFAVSDPRDAEALKREVVAWFQDHIAVAGEIVPQNGKTHVVAFVGPPGSGKTTTLSKIAAEYAVVRRMRVALLTVDVERIAAAKQLETYGEIMNLPLALLYQPEEASAALLRHREADLILVDTPGVNPRDQVGVERLGAFVRAIRPHEVHLVLDAPRDYKDALSTVKRFAPLADRLVLSKMDEVSSPGRVLSIAVRTDLPLSYLTSGPSPPEHFEVADVKKWVEKLFEG